MSALPTFSVSRDQAIDAMVGALRSEYIEAFNAGGDQKVRFFGRPDLSLIDVLADQLGGVDSEPMWREVIAIIGGAAAGQDVRLRASMFISLMAAKHARWHASDIVDGEQS